MKRTTAFLIAVFLTLGGMSALAQTVPFQVEVLPQTANMRWCPANCRIKHFANAGHILSVLEVDTESDPPWTWYRARTPSGVEAWIRSDLVRQRPDAAPVAQPQQQEVVEPFPVVPDNFCNTALFRSCRHGSEHDLWQAGYWAKNRYDHWERGGWNLDIVYHLNPCKAQRVCSSREQWDAGLIEAEAAYKATLPTATATLVKAEPGSKATSEPEPIVVTWLGLSAEDAEMLRWKPGTSTIADLFHPPAEIDDGETLIGKFEFDREQIHLYCLFWHNAGQDDPDDFIKMKEVLVTKYEDADKIKCLSGNVSEDKVAGRQWRITIMRTYNGKGVVRSGVKWKLSGTYTVGPEMRCAAHPDPCAKDLLTEVKTHITAEYDRKNPPTAVPAFIGSATCTGTYHEPDRTPDREITQYKHRCTYEDETPGFDLVLEFEYTHDKTRAFLKPPEDD